MASLGTHFTAFLFLFPTGLRRLLCSSSLYLHNPSVFKSKPWYFSDPKLKTFDLYTLLISLPIASFSDLFLFFTLSSHPSYKFAFSQQSFALFLFWVLLILITLREHLDPFLVPQTFVFVFAGIAFIIQYSVIGKGITGLSGVVYDLFGGLSLVCGFSCIFLSIRPSSFFAEFVFCLGLVLKGTWILQIGLTLYTDVFGIKGCGKVVLLPGEEGMDVKCALEEDGLRGVALVNFLFVGHAIGVLVLGFVLFGLMSWKRNLRGGEASGPLLARIESENSIMQANSMFEMD